jgi:hypothetical protein
VHGKCPEQGDALARRTTVSGTAARCRAGGVRRPQLASRGPALAPGRGGTGTVGLRRGCRARDDWRGDARRCGEQEPRLVRQALERRGALPATRVGIGRKLRGRLCGRRGHADIGVRERDGEPRVERVDGGYVGRQIRLKRFHAREPLPCSGRGRFSDPDLAGKLVPRGGRVSLGIAG